MQREREDCTHALVFVRSQKPFSPKVKAKVNLTEPDRFSTIKFLKEAGEKNTTIKL